MESVAKHSLCLNSLGTAPFSVIGSVFLSSPNKLNYLASLEL